MADRGTLQVMSQSACSSHTDIADRYHHIFSHEKKIITPIEIQPLIIFLTTASRSPSPKAFDIIITFSQTLYSIPVHVNVNVSLYEECA